MSTTYAVVQHSSGPDGGFVVRSVYEGKYVSDPYKLSDVIKFYKIRSAAERYADKLNR